MKRTKRIDSGRVGFILGLTWVILTLLAVWATAVHCKEKKRESTLTASPRVSIPSAQGIAVVSFTLKLVDDDVCSGRRWYWPDETTSYHESDCDPDNHPVLDTEQKHRVFGEGEFQVCVGLERPEGKTYRRLCDKFTVGGTPLEGR